MKAPSVTRSPWSMLGTFASEHSSFRVGDLCAPNLHDQSYDVIGCIEGLEHIDQQYQSPLVAALAKALKPGGTLVVSSPDNLTGKSGRACTTRIISGS